MFEKILQRIENNSIPVTESGCIIWLGAVQRAGYGCLRNENKNVEPIHRLVFRIKNNLHEIQKGQYVLHKCDVPSCINPNHLFIGSQFENMQDMSKKGRRGTWHPIGSANPNYKHGLRVKK